MSSDYIHRRILLHPPSSDWNTERDSCNHRVAQNRFIRFHESGSSTCLPASIKEGRRCGSRDLCPMPISTKHNTEQSDVLLVGANFGFPASISTHEEDSMGICGQTNGRSGWTQCFYV